MRVLLARAFRLALFHSLSLPCLLWESSSRSNLATRSGYFAAKVGPRACAFGRAISKLRPRWRSSLAPPEFDTGTPDLLFYFFLIRCRGTGLQRMHSVLRGLWNIMRGHLRPVSRDNDTSALHFIAFLFCFSLCSFLFFCLLMAIVNELN